MKRRKDDKGKVLKDGESQRKNGTYMFRYYDILRNRRTIYAKTLDELRSKEKQALQDVADGIIGTDSTLNDVFYAFINTNQRIAPRVRTSQKRMYHVWIENTWLGNKRVNSIVKSDIMRFYKEKKENGLSDGTIHNIHVRINSALNFAVEDNLIRRNCATHCVRPYNTTKTKYALSKQEVEKFLETAQSLNWGKHYMILIQIMLYTGLRIGEATGLTWKDVDLENRIIDVNHQYVLGDGNSVATGHIDNPKTKQSIRKVPIPNILYQVLKDWKLATYDKSMNFQTKLEGHHGFVAFTNTGCPINCNNVNHYIHKVIKMYNDTHDDKIRHATCHTFRHTFCTRLAESNINPKALQKIMGHSSYKTTFDIYINSDDEFTFEEFQKIDYVFG